MALKELLVACLIMEKRHLFFKQWRPDKILKPSFFFFGYRVAFKFWYFSSWLLGSYVSPKALFLDWLPLLSQRRTVTENSVAFLMWPSTFFQCGGGGGGGAQHVRNGSCLWLERGVHTAECFCKFYFSHPREDFFLGGGVARYWVKLNSPGCGLATFSGKINVVISQMITLSSSQMIIPDVIF